MTVDDRLAKIGFSKVYEDVRRVHYERYDKEYRYYHTVVIERRSVWNEFRLQSYDENLIDNKSIGNTNVALSTAELKLFLKKMKQKEYEYVKHRMIRI
jgi:hypothetical protein